MMEILVEKFNGASLKIKRVEVVVWDEIVS